MGGNWPTATIEEIAAKVGMGPFGSSIKVETFVPDGVPIISGQHLHGTRVNDGPGFRFITDEHAEKLANANVQRGDIVFTHAGNIGQAAYIPDDSEFTRYVISQRQFYMRCDTSKALPEYVTMYFKAPEGRHRLLANSSQVGVPSIARPVTYLRTIEIPLPSLAEQRAIAHILGTLDDKIELNRRMNETLEAMARALFKSWFVDFEPVRAKMEGRDTGLPEHIAELFPGRLLNAGSGDVPEGWSVKMLGDLAKVTSGKRPQLRQPTPSNDAKVPVWGGNGPMAYTSTALINQPILTTGRVGTLGSVFRVTFPCWPSDNTLVVKPFRRQAFEFLFLHMQRMDFAALNRGSTQPLLTQTDLKTQPLVSPTESVLEYFGTTLSTWYARVDEAENENRILAAIRDALLPRLVSGSLRVNPADLYAADLMRDSSND